MFHSQSTQAELLFCGCLFCLSAALCMYLSNNFDREKRKRRSKSKRYRRHVSFTSCKINGNHDDQSDRLGDVCSGKMKLVSERVNLAKMIQGLEPLLESKVAEKQIHFSKEAVEKVCVTQY